MIRLGPTVAVVTLAGLVVCTSASAAGSNASTTPGSTTTTIVAPAAVTTTTLAPGVPTPPVLTWGPCEADVDAEFECATLTVPLDYADLAGAGLGIALIRLPAESSRQGAILLNPGGPGGSGYDFAMNAAVAIDREFGLDRRFDIIGFDPRGVDRSGGIACVDDAEQDATLYLDDTPDTPEEEATLDAADERWVAGCLERYGDTLRHYSTANTARDMEWIRWGIGDAQISFLGISYGTYLGAVYATMFPDQVRAMVLDSALEPSGDDEFEQYGTQLVGFENAFNEWAAWCEEGADCPFTAIDVGARWDALLIKLDETPVTADGREVNREVMETATFAAMYDEMSWPVLASALADAETGDGLGLQGLADDYNERNDDGTYDSISDSNYVIGCASGFENVTPADPAALLAELQAAAPRFAADMTIEDFTDDGGCSDIMSEPGTLVAPSYQGSAPILVVGGLNDPATPFRWALELVGAMGPNAALVSYSGEGHGYLLVASCVDDAEAAAIRDLALPPVGTACDPDPDVPRPGWWDNIPVPAGVGPEVTDPTVINYLGAPPSLAYFDMWFYSGDTASVEEAYRVAFRNLGFEVYPTYRDDGFPIIPMIAPDGQYVDVYIFTPEELLEPDSNGVTDLIPAGNGVVVVVAYGDDE